jgi:hypothetical protein
MKDFGAVFRQSLSDFPCPVALGKSAPSFGLHRFNQGLRFVPPADEGFTLRGDKQRLLYKGRRRSHRFTILGDTAFEYDCILEKPPDTNVVTLLIEGAEHFDFFRQPDFIKDPLLAGSYAVYKKETLIGEGTGKLCHIHRPEIIDARGRRCWGDLAVVGNELRITIPEWWLGEAAYPVIVDPPIGTSTVGSQTTGRDPDNSDYDYPTLDNQLALNKYLVSQNGTGWCMVYVYTYNEEAEPYSRPCLFTNNNGKPYLKNSSQESEIDVELWGSQKPGWRNGNFKLNEMLLSGSYVWFGLFASYFMTRFDYGGECYKMWIDYDRYYPEYEGELPPYLVIKPTDTYCNIKWSWYFTYTEHKAENYVRTLSQTVKITDKRKIKADYKRGLKQKAGVQSAFYKCQNFFRQCAMTVCNSVNIGRFPAFYRSVADKIKVTAGFDQNRALSRKCSDDVAAHSDTKRIHDAFRKAADGLQFLDAQTFSVLFIRSVSDIALPSDKMRHLGSFMRGLSVTAGSVAETSHEAEYHRYHADTVRAQGSVFRGLILFVKIITKVFIRDYLLGCFLKAREEIVLKSAVSREIILDSKIN